MTIVGYINKVKIDNKLKFLLKKQQIVKLVTVVVYFCFSEKMFVIRIKYR